jgi:hypothetical protein
MINHVTILHANMTTAFAVYIQAQFLIQKFTNFSLLATTLRKLPPLHPCLRIDVLSTIPVTGGTDAIYP